MATTDGTLFLDDVAPSEDEGLVLPGMSSEQIDWLITAMDPLPNQWQNDQMAWVNTNTGTYESLCAVSVWDLGGDSSLSLDLLLLSSQ